MCHVLEDPPSCVCVCTYVFLHVQANTVHRTFDARKEYVATWLSAHETALLEYDTEGFTFVSFLFEIKGFYALVHCEWMPGRVAGYGWWLTQQAHCTVGVVVSGVHAC